MISNEVDPAPITTPARSATDPVDGRQEDPLDLQPGGDVVGELRLGNVGHESREVDEASYAAVGDGGRDGLRGHPVAVAEVAAVEGVHEVDDGVDVLDASATAAGSVTSHRIARTRSSQPYRSGRGGDEDAATTSWPCSSRWGTRRVPM